MFLFCLYQKEIESQIKIEIAIQVRLRVEDVADQVESKLVAERSAQARVLNRIEELLCVQEEVRMVFQKERLVTVTRRERLAQLREETMATIKSGIKEEQKRKFWNKAKARYPSSFAMKKPWRCTSNRAAE